MKENKAEGKFYLEKQVMTVGLFSCMLASVAIFALYFGIFQTASNVSRFWPYLVYTIISVTIIGMGIWHIKIYRRTFTCSTGMMAGMTIGMLAGFLFGGIIGATNGIFMGSVFGMSVGMFTGAWCTRSCGIMSIMEGLMAGLMGGIMGAMTTMMMISDNIALFMPILVGAIGMIMGGMSVMIYKESADNRKDIKRGSGYEMFTYVFLLFILAVVTSFIMVFGPKSALVAV
jgi:hypothetical protein